MGTLYPKKPLVSVGWLLEHLNDPDLIILDASIPKASDIKNILSGGKQIPGTRFFDIKKKFSSINAPFPNTFPSEDQFTSEARTLGINKNSFLVIYDDKGIYSSPRVWWMFRAMGHSRIAVLNGGLPEWIRMEYPLEGERPYEGTPGNFTAKYNEDYFYDFSFMQDTLGKDNVGILDARSEERFTSQIPEPRKGLRSGTIPGSQNLPYTQLLNDNKFKETESLKTIFDSKINDFEQTIFSCGSGITACILALGANLAGYDRVSVYDGSWTEWGSLTNE